jgi:hypothetical protein
MKRIRLLPAQQARTGYTDLFVLTHADLTTAADNTDQTVTLDTLAFGDIIKYDAFIQIKTAFDAATASADNALTVALGVTGATTQIIGASALAASGAGTAAKTTYCTAAGGVAYPVPTGGKDLLATFDITDADGALVDYTAGEIHIYMHIIRESELVVADSV